MRLWILVMCNWHKSPETSDILLKYCGSSSRERVMELTVHLYYDPDSHNWSFRVPALRIVGGGQDTSQEAGRAALDAIAFTLEADSQDDADAAGDIVEHYR